MDTTNLNWAGMADAEGPDMDAVARNLASHDDRCGCEDYRRTFSPCPNPAYGSRRVGDYIAGHGVITRVSLTAYEVDGRWVPMARVDRRDRQEALAFG